MKWYLALGAGLLAGTVIGATAVTGLYAQAKPSVLVITEIDISDPEGYGNEFVPKAQAIKPAGAKFLAIGGVGTGAKPIISLEGTPPKRVTIQQWDSFDALKAWYNGKDYQEALTIGRKYVPSVRRGRSVTRRNVSLPSNALHHSRHVGTAA
jgi:uncharacterized protein (DUF1330 family)